MADNKRGADHLVDAFRARGVDTIFSLSGNQIMPVYDALLDADIRLIHTRHEGAAVYMAEAYAQLTGKTGIALITAGPGFANAVSAMWSARESQTPIVVLSGDSPVSRDGHGAFQEMDQQTGAQAFVKCSVRVERAADLAGAFSDAAALARAGTPGPVHISLPDDVLRVVTDLGDAQPMAVLTAAPVAVQPVPGIANLIRAAARPLIIAGPSFARYEWEQKFASAAQRDNIPMIALESPRGLRAPRIGTLTSVLGEADLIVALSLPPNFMLGFGEAPAIAADASFILISDDAAAINTARDRLGRERVTVVAMSAAAAGLGDEGALGDLKSGKTDDGWRARVEEAVAWRPPEWREIAADAPPFHAASVCYEIKKFIDKHPETSLTIDGGEVGQWAQSILDTDYSIINGPSGAIGGSIPYAIAAKQARPEAPSIAILGDGTAGFYWMEFETALREELPFVAIIGNDAKWNAEHQIQVRDYGENRAHACEMLPTRYDQMAEAMGCHGENITNLADLVPAIERAMASGKPACINVPLQSHAAPVIKRG